MELVFESRRNFSNFRGTLHFVQHRPRIHPQLLVKRDTFVDGAVVSAYGNVMYDAGRFRMWYQCAPQDWPGTVDTAAVAHAESDDGITWRKTPVGIVKHGPDANHLTNLGLHSPSITCDPSDPPTHRYRAIGRASNGYFLGRQVARTGYYSAHSADGLHWEIDETALPWSGGDVLTSIYHPGRGHTQVSLKNIVWINRMRRRAIHNATICRGVSSGQVSALYPDEFTDIAAMQRGHVSGDFYGMGMMAAGRSTVGFLWNFWHDLPYDTRAPYGMHGHGDISLVFQEEEGDRWLSVPGRPDFISHRDVSVSQLGWVYSMASPVLVGDEHRLYFSACNWEHARFRGSDGQVPEPWQAWVKAHAESGITFAHWPAWRLFGFQTPADATFDIELTDITTPVMVKLNYQVHDHGRVAVSVGNHDQSQKYALDQAVNLTGDEIAATVAWKHGQVIEPNASGKLKLTIHLQRATVYAYEVVKM